MSKLSSQQIDTVVADLHSINKPLYQGDDLNIEISQSFNEIREICDQFTEKGSGFWIESIQYIELSVGKYQPHKGGCSSHSLPAKLNSKKCLINLKTETDCFMYSILASLHPASRNGQRISSYRTFIDLYDFSSCRGIVDLKQIDTFERSNNISVNVYSYNMDDKYVIPIRITKHQLQKHVLLFLYGDHYYPITSFQRLLSSKSSYQRKYCQRCLIGFHDEQKLIAHIVDCDQYEPQRIVMPKRTGEPSYLMKKNFSKEEKHPFVIYADFECLSIPTGDPQKPFRHEPCSYGYIVVDWEKNVLFKNFCHGNNIVGDFLREIRDLQQPLQDYLKANIKPLVMTDEDEDDFKKTDYCVICGQYLDLQKRVRDHCHLTGVFRGAAHPECNLQRSLPTRIPVFFHNLKNYDGHIIIKNIAENIFNARLIVIPSSLEKYIGFFIGQFAFLDSLAFLPTSLDTLSSNLSTDDKLHFLRQEWSTGDLSEVLKKATLPYEYISSIDKFYDNCLPSKDKFYSSLTDSNISDEMYSRLEKIWHQFNCEVLGDLIDVYLKVDVYMLAASFENFRETSMKDFKIDPPHYMTGPGLSFAAAFRRLQIEVELFCDIDKLMMIEKGIRGGLTTVARRYVKANNPNVPGYDGGDQTHLLYLDVNNLYGYAMCSYLPYAYYAWKNFDDEEAVLRDLRFSSGYNYIYEVDLEYPSELHDEHDDFPLAPHKLKIDNEMLSPYAKRIVEKLQERGHHSVSSEKLVATFLKREKYVVHGLNLKFYMEKGLKVTKIHRILKFSSLPWLQDYIEFCTSKRQQAKDPFTSSLYKLFVNSIYGKLMEDKRKHVKVDVTTSEPMAARRLRKHLLQRFKIIDENKVMFQMKKDVVLMNKPIVTGFTVLELSKLHVYTLYYDTFKCTFGDRCRLIYSDTDSLLIELKSNHLIEDLKQVEHVMDLSDLPQNHPLHSDEHKKEIGYLKDEMAGDEIHEVVAIKPKLYVIKSASGVKKRAKGVQRQVVANKLSFDDYKRCLFQEEIHMVTNRRLGSTNHDIHMYTQEKIAITPLEDKRYLLGDGISSLAYGHYKIERED
ncbi:uncharacterized protein LOC128392015 [Panonychus citri]|nr:uncharacterized protein LOC128389967 [Panonychus citri]XP_053207959.1 uncharacterized protein LOC128392015 [Panonychus citri]